jgi:uncharacterized coiled-coil protein SlyX
MNDTDEFSVTEAGMRACIETIYGLNQAVAELSRAVEAANEAIIILSHEVEDIRQNASRGYIPGGYTPA